MTRPIPMAVEALAIFLDDMAQAVRSGDSLEGSIEYLMPDEDDERETLPDDARMVTAAVRFNNLQGQGSMTLLGRFDQAPVAGDRPVRIKPGELRELAIKLTRTLRDADMDRTQISLVRDQLIAMAERGQS